MDVVKSYQQGEIIFKQGDPGDSMFMIKEGSVEVYKETPQGEVLLTVQSAGEVIGMLTFFNSGNRLASARARTLVEGQIISRTAGQDPLAKLPKWVQIVLKEFTTCLDQINEQYAKSQHSKSELMGRTVDSLFISAQVASCLMTLGPLKTKKTADGREMIVIPEVIDLITKCLSFEKRDIDRVMEVFKTTGLLKLEKNLEIGKDSIPVAGIQKLKFYVDFAQTSRSGKNKRLVQATIPSKHRKQIAALRDYVHKTGADPSKPYTADLVVLLEQYPNLMEMDIDSAALDTAEKLELIEIKRMGDKATISFHPGELLRTMIAVNTVRRLRSEPGTEENLEL